MNITHDDFDRLVADKVCPLCHNPVQVVGVQPDDDLAMIRSPDDKQDLPACRIYADAMWNTEDIQSRRPKWTAEQCQRFLEIYEWKIRDGMVETGWYVIDFWLDQDDPDGERGDDDYDYDDDDDPEDQDVTCEVCGDRYNPAEPCGTCAYDFDNDEEEVIDV